MMENAMLKQVNEELKEQIKLISEKLETVEKRWKSNA